MKVIGEGPSSNIGDAPRTILMEGDGSSNIVRGNSLPISSLPKFLVSPIGRNFFVSWVGVYPFLWPLP